MITLAKQKCVHCEGGELPLRPDEVVAFSKQIPADWEVLENAKIRKTFAFKNFVEAMEFGVMLMILFVVFLIRPSLPMV